MSYDFYQFQFYEIIRAEVGDSSNETLIKIVRKSVSEISPSVRGILYQVIESVRYRTTRTVRDTLYSVIRNQLMAGNAKPFN